MFKKFINRLVNRIDFSRLRATNKTRKALKDQNFLVEGKKMNALEYIELVANLLPATRNSKGVPVNHRELLRKYYYKFDLAGINYYRRMISRLSVKA